MFLLSHRRKSMSAKTQAQKAYNRYKQAQKNQKKKKVVTTQTQQQQKTNRAVTNRATGNYSAFKGVNPGRTSEGSVQNTTSKRYTQEEAPARRNQQELQRQRREHQTQTSGQRMSSEGQSRFSNLTKGALEQSVGSARKAFSGFMSGVTESRAKGDTYGGTQAHRNGTQQYMTRREDRLSPEQLKKKEAGIQKSRTTSHALDVAAEKYTKEESKAASKQIARGTEKIEKGKEGLGAVGRFGADLYTGAVQLGADIGIGALTGSALLPMGVRAFGGAVDEAEQAGASWKKQMMYGATTAGIELGTEKLFNVGAALNKAYGAGVGDKLVEKLTKKVGKSALKGGLSEVGAAALTEGLEEMVAEGLEPMVANAIYANAIGGDAVQTSLLNDPAQAGLNMLRAGGIGAALGAPLGGAGVVMQNRQGKKISENAQNIYGEDGVKEMARQARESEDEGDAAFAQAVYNAINEGKGVANIQVAKLQGVLNSQKERDAKRTAEAYNVAERTIAENNYSAPRQAANAKASESVDVARRAIAEQIPADVEMSEAEADRIVTTAARIGSGVAGESDIREALSSAESITVMEAVTGLDLGGKSKSVQHDMLIQYAAQQYVDAAQRQTEYDNSTLRNAYKTIKEKDLGVGGQTAFDKIFEDEDIRGLADGSTDFRGDDINDVHNKMYTFEAFYRAGTADMTLEEIRQKDNPVFASLTPRQQEDAYIAGRNDALAEQNAAYLKDVQVGRKSQKAKTKVRPGHVSLARLSDENKQILTQSRPLFEALAKALGIEIEFRDEITNVNGEVIEEGVNGHYQDGKITISMDNDKADMSKVPLAAIAYVFEHEVTHHMKVFAPAEFFRFKQFVKNKMMTMESSDGNFANRYEEEIAKKRRQYGNVEEDLLMEEILADASIEFIQDEEFCKEICEQDADTAHAIIKALRNLMDKIREIMANIVLTDSQRQTLFSELDILKDAEQMWLAGIRVAAERRNAVGEIERDVTMPSRKEWENIGFHAGDLGKAEPRSQMSGGRGTGHYGTGTYFVGNEDAINIGNYAKRPHEVVDFTKYNLWRPLLKSDARDLHDFLKSVNTYWMDIDSPVDSIQSIFDYKNKGYKVYDEYYDIMLELRNFESWKREIPIPQETLNEYGEKLRAVFDETGTEHIFNHIVGDDFNGNYTEDMLEELGNEFERNDEWHESDWYKYAHALATNVGTEYGALSRAAFLFRGVTAEQLKQKIKEVKAEMLSDTTPANRQDTAATRLMKKLGYEGVDVRGTDMDNTYGGSVIYDLKDEDLARKLEIGTARLSRKFTPEEQQEHRTTFLDTCKAFYGEKTTDDFFETGYIFPDGKMPKMGMDGVRGEDHRMCDVAYDDLAGGEALVQFMSEGNIRIMPEDNSMELEIEPTAAQYDKIAEYVDQMDPDEMEFYPVRVDFADGRGYTADTMTFENPNSDIIVSSIKAHFAGGTVTPMRQFLSRKDSEGRYLSEGQMEYFQYSKARDAYGHLVPVYHSSDAEFTEFDREKLGESNPRHFDTSFGFFTTPVQEFSKRFGKNTKKMYADIRKPIIHPMDCHIKYPGREDEIVREWFEAVDPYQIPWFEELVESGEEESIYDAYMNAFAYEAFDYAEDNREALMDAGYDGIELVEGTERTLVKGSKSNDPVSSFIVFYSSQLKDVDNLNPTRHPDIMMSRKAADALMGDSLLREGRAVTLGEVEEGELIPMYHGSGAADFERFNLKGGMLGEGAYFTSSYEEAADYAIDALGIDMNEDGDYEWNGEVYDLGSLEDELAYLGYLRGYYLNITDEKDITRSKYGGGEHVIAVARSNDQIMPIEERQRHEISRMPDFMTPLDAEYFAAIERFDIDEADRLVREAAEEAGYVTAAFHGTQEEFNVFDTTSHTEFGAHFGTEKAAEDILGAYSRTRRGHIMDVFLDLGDTIEMPDIFGSATVLHDYVTFINEFNGDYAAWDRHNNMVEEDRGFDDVPNTKEEFPENEYFQKMRDYIEESGNSSDSLSVDQYFSKLTQDYLKSLGYNSITYTNDNEDPGSTSYIVFDPSQIKEATFATFDNEGNIIPLSQRFNRESDDIRYSKREVSFTEEDRKELEDAGLFVSEGGSVSMLSRKSWEETDKKKLKKRLLQAGFTEDEIDSWMKEIDSVAAIIGEDAARLDYIAARQHSFKKPDGDYYKYTLDASTLCAKRLLYQGTYDAIMHVLKDVPLMENDVIRIRQMMAERMHEVPCGICYVESQRKTLGRYASEWLEGYKGEYVPSLDEVVSTDGLEWLRTEHPQTYEDFTKAMAAKGVSSPKVVQLRTDYREDLVRMTAGTVEYLNMIGGLRWNSFSDFETPHLIDFMQATLDMSAKGLMGMAYTKVPNLVKVFGATGVKFNLSLIPKVDENGNVEHDADGRIVFDDVEGMSIEDAMELRDKYPDNVATILVAKDKAHMLEAMNDDRVDFIIPFHRSKWTMAEFEKLGLRGYEDFATGDQENPIFPSEYWDYSITQKKGGGRKNAETYLKLCAERGEKPAFSKLLVDNGDGSYSLPKGNSEEAKTIRNGYYKLIIEGKMFNHKTGKGAPQQKVTMNVDMDAAREVLAEYDGDPNALPVAEDVVRDFVKEKTGRDMKLSRKNKERDDEYMAAIESGDVDAVQAMLDQAAKDAGYPIKVFHGTPDDNFTVFIPGAMMHGFSWFTEDSGYAYDYATRDMNVYAEDGYTAGIFEGYLKDGNYLDVGSVEGYIKDDDGSWSDGMKHVASVVNMSPDELYKEVEKDPEFYDDGYVYDLTKSKGFADIIQNLGYDGIKASEFMGAVTYGILDSSAFKRTVTYEGDSLDGEDVTMDDVVQRDNAGNIIPLSERFNMDEKDIRYSLKAQPADVDEDEVTDIMASDPTIVDTMYGWGMATPEGQNLHEQTKEELIAKIEKLKQEMTLTEGKILDEKSVREEMNKLVVNMGIEEDRWTGQMLGEVRMNKTNRGLVEDLVQTAKTIWKELQNGNYEAAAISAMNVSEHVVDNLLLTEDTMYRQYKELVDYLKNTKWTLDPKYYGDFPEGFAEFKKEYRGKLRIVKTGGRSPDEMWGEMCELWPEFFQEIDPTSDEQYMSPANMLKRMAEVRDSLDPYSLMLSEENQQLILRDAAADILEIVSNGKPIETWADKRENYYREKIAKLKARQQEAIRDIKEKQNWKDAEKKLATQMAEGKKKAQQQRAKQESKEKKSEDKGKRQTIAKISKNLDWLSGRLLRPSDDKHLPEGYRNVVAQMLAAIDPQTERSKALEEKYGVSKKRFKWLQLRSEYEKIAAGESYGFILDDQIMADMQELSDVLGDGDFALANMTYDELQKVYRIVRSIRHGIQMQNRMFSDELKATAEEYGRNAIETAEMYIDKHGTDRKGVSGMIQGSGMPLLDEGMLTPRDYFEYIGGGLNDAFLAMRRGQDEQIEKINYMRNFFGDIFRDYGKTTKIRHRAKPGSELEAWRDGKNTKSFQCEGGSIELTPSQVMSLYCLMKREQAQGHILGSGIKAAVVNKKNLLLGENLKEFFTGKGDKKTRGRRVSVTAEDIMNIIGSLTQEQRDIADKMQTLMSTVMSDWGNEASMKMFGYRKFTEENYFPIECESTYLATDFDVRQTAERVKNPNFAKSTQKGANNPVVIDDIFSVCADHCNRMAMYSSYAPAIADFQRVYNFVDRDPETGLQNGSVKESLQAAYGDRALKYIERFMTDLNGTTPTTHDDLNRFVAKSLANYKKAAIGGNLRVAVQQPTAMIRALLYISPKYFMGKMSPVKEIREMKEHCPIALWKSWGFSQVDMARDLEDIMMNQEWSRFDMMTMEIYNFLDLVTWGQIWRAVKNEVKAEHKDVEVGSDEFYRLCNERASYIFDKSQVVDSVFHKSQVMRNTDVMSKMLTSFMAEPTRTFNMVGSEIQRAAKMWQDGDKAGAMKVYTKAFNVFILNAATVSMAAAVIDMMRGKGGDDDDDDDKLSLIMQNFIENMKSNALPHTFIPGVSDVVELFTDSWGAKNMSLEGYEKLAKAVKDMFDEDKTWAEKIKGLVENGGYVFGIPTKNVMRELQTALDLFGIEVHAAEETDEVEEVKFTDKFFGMFKGEDKKSEKKSGKKKDDEEEEEELEDYIDTTNKHGLVDKALRKMHFEEGGTVDNFLDKRGLTLTNEEAREKAFNEKAEKVKAKGEGKEGDEKDKAIWKAATEKYTKYLDQGNMDTIKEMRTIYHMAGGDTQYFDEKILGKMKSSYKKTIGDFDKLSEQEDMKNYMIDKGMTEEEISSEIVYKSDMAKKFAIAAQEGKDVQAIACLVSLYMAGMTDADAQKLYENRWRYGSGKNKAGHGTGQFSWPCSGRISSYFGRRNAPTAGASSNHPSIDIAVSSGTTVCAADGGVVIYTGYNGGYGNSVGIDHGNGYVTYYNHLSQYNVQKGQMIKKGQPVALSGNTGTSTGPHLDFKILKDGTPVDPMKYLN